MHYTSACLHSTNCAEKAPARCHLHYLCHAIVWCRTWLLMFAKTSDRERLKGWLGKALSRGLWVHPCHISMISHASCHSLEWLIHLHVAISHACWIHTTIMVSLLHGLQENSLFLPQIVLVISVHYWQHVLPCKSKCIPKGQAWAGSELCCCNLYFPSHQSRGMSASSEVPLLERQLSPA